MGPYREATATEVMEAESKDGPVRLELAPRHTLLDVGELYRFSVTERFATLTRAMGRNRRRKKKRSIPLDDTRLLVAQGVPPNDVGIWHEPKTGVVTRLFGIRARELLDDDGLAAARKLERLVRRLEAALRPHGHGAVGALEVGRGADRVLIMDFGDRLVLHVRRLFRERPRRALDVYSDGKIVFPGRGRKNRGAREIECTSRFGVTAIGDFIRFAAKTGEDLGAISIPWIAPETRHELVEIIADRIHQAD